MAWRHPRTNPFMSLRAADGGAAAGINPYILILLCLSVCLSVRPRRCVLLRVTLASLTLFFLAEKSRLTVIPVDLKKIVVFIAHFILKNRQNVAPKTQKFK